MTYLAAEGDTWGIPGQTFLMIYLVLGVVVLGAVVLWRRRQLSGPTGLNGSARRQLTPTEVALLNGGRELAVYSSLASLRAAEAVQVVNGHLTQVGPPSSGAPMLDRAIYAAAGQRTLRSRDVQSDPGVSAVLDRTEADLAAEGMLVPPATRSRVRRAALLGVALLAFGVARAIAGHQNGRPITNLVLLLVLVAVATLALLAVPRLTRAAKASLTTMRRSSKHLRPDSSPSWSTYGPGAAALGVGLFGTAAIWAADPAFAADAEIQRQSIGSNGWTGGSDGGGGGGGCGG